MRSREWVVLPAILLLVPGWHLIAVEDQNNVPRWRHSLEDMRTGVQFLYENAPANSMLVAPGQSWEVMSYYIGPGTYWLDNHGWDKADRIDRYRLAERSIGVEAVEAWPEALAGVRQTYGLASTEPLWIVDAQWDPVELPAGDVRDFGGAIRVCKVAGASASTDGDPHR